MHVLAILLPASGMIIRLMARRGHCYSPNTILVNAEFKTEMTRDYCMPESIISFPQTIVNHTFFGGRKMKKSSHHPCNHAGGLVVVVVCHQKSWYSSQQHSFVHPF
jgi:hypothetical protein